MILITSACAVAVTALLYGAMLYFCVATASLSDYYQPGIEVLQAWISPGLWLGVVVLCAVVFRSVLSARVAVYSCFSAFMICAFMYPLVAQHSGNSNAWVFPQNRSLENTLDTALLRPNFSNRSKGSIVGSAGIALFWLGVSSYVLRRRKLTSPLLTPPTSQRA